MTTFIPPPQGKLQLGEKEVIRLAIDYREFTPGKLLRHAYENNPEVLPPWSLMVRAGDGEDDESVEERKKQLAETDGVQVVDQKLGNLDVGDFVFFHAETLEPVVVVERKTLADANSSIIGQTSKDSLVSEHNRSISQFYRLGALGLPLRQIYYLIEATCEQLYKSDDECIRVWSNLTSRQVCHGVSVEVVENGIYSALWLARMYVFLNKPHHLPAPGTGIEPVSDKQANVFKIWRDYFDKLRTCDDRWAMSVVDSMLALLPEELREVTVSTFGISLPSPERQRAFCESVNPLKAIPSQRKALLENPYFQAGAMFIQLPGIAGDKALALAKQFGSIYLLGKAYELIPYRQGRERFLSNHFTGIGVKTSTGVYERVVPYTKLRAEWDKRDVDNGHARENGQLINNRANKAYRDERVKEALEIFEKYRNDIEGGQAEEGVFNNNNDTQPAKKQRRS